MTPKKLTPKSTDPKTYSIPMENPKPLVSDDAIDRKADESGSRGRGAFRHGMRIIRDLYEKDRAEKDKTIAELREALERLSKQVTLCEFRDEHGHLLEMNAAYLDVQALLSTLPKPKD